MMVAVTMRRSFAPARQSLPNEKISGKCEVAQGCQPKAPENQRCIYGAHEIDFVEQVGRSDMG